MFDTVLVANRGEIAVRVMRTLRGMGIRAVAVYSDADAGARHVLEADEAVRIGPPPAVSSYLDIEAVIAAARRTGAQAIHPGYGFLSENPAFAQACAAAGITFIGPPVAAISDMGDKIAAKTRVAAAGVPVVPGRHDPRMDDEAVAAAVVEVGYPAMLKPSAGGGGKGMRVLREGADVPAEIAAARREARKSFGDDRLLVERYIDSPRHIEVQVLADEHGGIIHLGERECSLQRRHQKVIEEAPSPFVSDEVRERLGGAAIDAARSCDYVGAGTVEFIVDGADPDSFYFLEMNTRLQVEHPVTEIVTGWDLVEWQVRIAAGERLPDTPVSLRGHAIEARVYAEDPAREFLPSTGTLLAVDEKVPVRVDSGVRSGQHVTADYDPMIAKVIAGGDDRDTAVERLRGALAGVSYLGVTTNTGFLQRLLDLPEVRKGHLHTGLIDERPEIAADPDPDDHVVAAAGLAWALGLQPAGDRDSWTTADGWRASAPPAPAAISLRTPTATRLVTVAGPVDAALVTIDGGEPVAASGRWVGGDLEVTFAGETRRYRTAREDHDVWLAGGGAIRRFTEVDRLQAERSHASETGVGAVHSPMPGSVIAVAVSVGDAVTAGQPLATVEAMKMEHTLVAPADAVVTHVAVAVGAQVGMDEVLVTLEPVTTEDPGE